MGEERLHRGALARRVVEAGGKIDVRLLVRAGRREPIEDFSHDRIVQVGEQHAETRLASTRQTARVDVRKIAEFARDPQDFLGARR